MKKVVLSIVSIVLLLAMTFGLTACSIMQDYKEVRSNLRDNDYEVETVDGEDIYYDADYSALLDVFAYLLEYDVMIEHEDEIDELHPELGKLEKYIDKVIAAKDEDYESLLFVVYFDDAEYANEYYELIEPFFQIAKNEGLDHSEFDIAKDDLVYGKSGSVIYFGTNDALEIAK